MHKIMVLCLILLMTGCGGSDNSADLEAELNGDWTIIDRKGRHFGDITFQLANGQGEETFDGRRGLIKIVESGRDYLKLHIMHENAEPDESGLYIKYIFNSDGTVTGEYWGQDVTLIRK